MPSKRPQHGGAERSEVMRITGCLVIDDDLAVELAPRDGVSEPPASLRAHPSEVTRTESYEASSHRSLEIGDDLGGAPLRAGGGLVVAAIDDAVPHRAYASFIEHRRA